MSGGIDSSYLAYLVTELGLRPLALHMDNGWNSQEAVKNIKNVCTKLNIDYQLNNILSQEEQEELYDYFLNEAQDDSILNAEKYFDDSYEDSELRIMRVKFLSELAN